MQTSKTAYVGRMEAFMNKLQGARVGKSFEQVAASLYTAEKLGQPKVEKKEEPKVEAPSGGLGGLIV
jgi:hypothetical protein